MAHGSAQQSVLISGVDAGGTTREVKVDAEGNLGVVFAVPANARTGLIPALVTLGGGTAGSLNKIQATPYTEQASAAQRSISSSSASDAAAGVGARQVKITYFDNTMAGPFTETVTLNGTTAVATVASDIRFIEKMEVVSVGSTGWNIGTITLYVNNAGGGGTIGTIGLNNIAPTQGDNRTGWGHHYVPVDNTVSLATLIVSTAGTASATFFLRKADPLMVSSPNELATGLIATSGAFTRALAIPLVVVGPAVISAWMVPVSNNTTAYLSYDFSEVSNV